MGHVQVTRAKPRGVATDRRMSGRANEAVLRAMGIAQLALPTRGNPFRTRRLFERRRAFRPLVRGRSGQEREGFKGPQPGSGGGRRAERPAPGAGPTCRLRRAVIV